MKNFNLILVALITTFFVIGCSKDESINSPKTEKIKELAIKSKSEFDKEILRINKKTPLLRSSEITDADINNINSAIDFTKSHSVKSFFMKENLNPLIIDMAEFYRNNLNKQDVYELISEKYSTLSSNEMTMAFNITHYSFFIDQIITDSGIIQTRRASGACMVAVAGAVVGAMSAVAIGNVAGLIWWGASYSLTLAGVATSC